MSASETDPVARHLAATVADHWRDRALKAEATLGDMLQVLRMVDDNHRVDAGEKRKAWRGRFVVDEVRRVIALAEQATK